jgi:hypothetical protein
MLRTILSRLGALLLLGLLVVGWFPNVRAGDDKPAQKPDPNAETTKKLTNTQQIAQALPKKVTIDYQGQSLQEVLQHVSKKTGMPIVVDTAIQFNGMIGFAGVPPGVPGVNNVPTTLKIQDAPLGTGLKQFLQSKNLTYTVLNGKLAVTSPQQALVLSMRQSVDVELKKVPVHKALQDLALKTGANILFDPNPDEAGQKEVTLKLDGVALETAVRLIAFKGGLKAVRVDDIVVVTTAKEAPLLPAETPLPNAYPPHFQDVNDMGGVGGPGFAPPPFGVPGVPARPVDPAGVVPAPVPPPVDVPPR